MTANQEARRLRKLGYRVRVVTLSAGMDRTATDINARIFTAIC
ncbi:glycosyltransferase family 4 protein [Sphingomonas sp. Leaf231]|nr:glycosyltransferase family 4 protein [Sphingomonas sp. Leaf231]